MLDSPTLANYLIIPRCDTNAIIRMITTSHCTRDVTVATECMQSEVYTIITGKTGDGNGCVGMWLTMLSNRVTGVGM